MRSFNPANAITLTGLLGGVVCIFCLQVGLMVPVVIILPCLFLLDKLDGMVARKLNCASELGAQLDSLADAVNFGVLIALYTFTLAGGNAYVGAAGVFYAVCACWRLARFNSEPSSPGFFCGVPTTNAAAWVFIVLPLIHFLPPSFQGVASVIVLIGAALFMVSTINYSNRGLTTKLLYILVPLALGLALYQML